MTNGRKPVTDYYKKLRKHLENDPSANITDAKLPGELTKELVTLVNVSNKSLKSAYFDNSFTEEHWAEMEKVCALYNSPLTKALR